MEKKNFETPELEVSKFSVEDIVTTSNGGEEGGDDWSGGDF